MANPDRERMSSVDTAWLRMERPYNLMMIVAVVIYEDKLRLDALRKVFETRFLSHKRFKQRVIQTPGAAYWETDPHFELSSHIRRIGLPGKGGKEELEELAGDLMSTPLDHSKPLWQVHLVEDYQRGSAAIFRFHHCIADGLALVHVFLSMTETAPGVYPDSISSEPVTTISNKVDHEGGIFRQLLEPVDKVFNTAVKTGKELIHEGVDVVTHPSGIVGFARQGVGLTSEAAKLLVMSDDPQTRFKGKPGVVKRVAWAEPLPLSEVKTIGKALGCSVNDVLLSSVSGALRAYLIEKGDPVAQDLEIRALVPVNLRPLEQARKLGNYFGLVYLALPIGIENPLERLYKVRSRMSELKGSYQAVLALGLLSALGLGPNLLQASALKVLTKKATAVMTNVPGPQKPLYQAGAKIAEIMFWVPQTRALGMGVSILSFNDRVHFGLVTDAKLVNDPQNIISRFSEEFEKLLLMTLMEPWGKHLDAKAVETSLEALSKR